MGFKRLGVVLSAVACASPASASVYSDDLTKCLVAKTSEGDKSTFMRWAFALMSASPEVGAMSNVTQKQRDDLNRDVGTLLERLMLADCRTETKQVMKFDGLEALGGAFEYVGKVAMRGLMQHPSVEAYSNRLGEGISTEKWEAFLQEAGLPAPKAKK